MGCTVDEANRMQLVRSWINYQQAEDGSPEQEIHAWAFDAFWETAWDSPSLCLQLCEDALTCELDDLTRAVLAAGPLEDSLAEHGAAIIEEVEQRAARNPKFRHLLGGVWQSTIPGEIWARLCKAREAVW
jgi:hypothetical protein